MNRLLEKLNINVTGIRYLKNVAIIDTNDDKYVVKKNNKRIVDIYNYLINKNFNYFPRVLTSTDEEYEITEFIEDIKVDDREKIKDMISLVSILHLKTTYYKELNLNDIKKTYEEMTEQISYLFNYYQELQNIIEEEIYMEPSNYILISNITKIYILLSNAKEYLDKWYNEIQKKKTIRFSLNHKNLKKEHLIEGDNPYLISWDLADKDIPVLDIYNIFINNYKDINIETMLFLYEDKNRLYNHEYLLLMSKICTIPKIDIKKDIYEKCQDISNLIIYVDKVIEYISNQNQNKSNKDK